MTAIGDVVLIRDDVEMHRPPRRYVVEAITAVDVKLSVLAKDVCAPGTCAREFCDHASGGSWFGQSVIATPVAQDPLW